MHWIFRVGRAKHGYSGKSMGQGSARIALLLDYLESDYQLDIIAGVRRAAARSGARVVIIAGAPLGTQNAPELRNFVYDYLQDARIDGIVALSGSLSNRSGVSVLQGLLTRLNKLPAVTIGVPVEGVVGVSVDNVAGSQAVVEHLIEVHGARRLALFRGPAESGESMARLDGFRRALAKHSIEQNQEWVFSTNLVREDGAEAAEALLSVSGFRPGKLDAIVCANDDTALGAIEVLHRRGIGVPKPIAVVGFDDSPGASSANPPLTTINQQVRLQGEIAAKSLLDYIERGAPLVNSVLDATLVIRDSCGCRSRIQNDSADLSFERPKVAKTMRLALIERRAAIAAQLSRAARGRMMGVHEWEGRLIDALAAQVDADEGGAFYWEFERVARAHGFSGGDPMVCHDVLTELRLQALVCVLVQPDLRSHIEDVLQEARLTLARVASSVAREHGDASNLRMRLILKACLRQVGDADVEELANALDEHLPTLGIQAYSLTRLLPERDELEVLVSRASGLRRATQTVLAKRTLGHDESLEGMATTVVMPLTYAGEAVGLATCAWGASDPFLYEELRELFATAIFCINQKDERFSAGGS